MKAPNIKNNERCGACGSRKTYILDKETQRVGKTCGNEDCKLHLTLIDWPAGEGGEKKEGAPTQGIPSPGLVWTREKPTQDGWYMVKSFYVNGKPAAGFNFRYLMIDDELEPLDRESGVYLNPEFHLWAGPIPEPVEAGREGGGD